MRTLRAAPLLLSSLDLTLTAATVSQSGQTTHDAAGSRTVFARRILPILRSQNPPACAECHLSGVDLKQYIRPTEAGARIGPVISNPVIRHNLLKYYADTIGKPRADCRTPANAPAFYQGHQEMNTEWKPGWGDMPTLRVTLQN
jgi:hypothetical protein